MRVLWYHCTAGAYYILYVKAPTSLDGWYEINIYFQERRDDCGNF
jgi:hypothetical protein